MSIWKVNSESLNLRRTPKVEDGNIIQALPLAQEVTVTDEIPSDRWWAVQTLVNGATLKGFVSAAFLRKPVSQAKEALISAAVYEWLRFDQGNKLEYEDPQYKYVGEYWGKIGLNLDGRDRDQPWSTAFISFVARKAGYSNFKFAAAHHFYIRDAVEKRRSSDTTAAFWGFNLDEHKPQLGDLVCRWRESPVLSINDLPDGGFKGHCDIVVEIRDVEVRTLGGNVDNSVSITSYPLNANGFLKSTNRVFAVLGNNK